MCVVGRPAPALIAMLSSPVSIHDFVIVTLVEFAGSIPSVLRAFFGEWILTPHTVNPSPLPNVTWKFGEFRSVMRYIVKLLHPERTTRRGLFCEPPARACSARSHHVMLWPIIF